MCESFLIPTPHHLSSLSITNPLASFASYFPQINLELIHFFFFGISMATITLVKAFLEFHCTTEIISYVAF